MKQISTSLTSKLKEDSVVERDYIIFSGETTKHYLWFKLYDDCYKDGNFIGTFILKRIEISYNDSDLEFKNKEFNAYKEYKLDNGTWESINYGTFVVTDVQESDTKEETTITAYDYGLKFSNTYKTDLDYASGTVTLFQVLQEVCQKVGIELENTSIDNGNFIVDSNQFTEASLYGNVITAIAQMSCNFAKITPENKLKLLFKNDTNIIIETKDYEEFEDKRDTLPYTAVSLGVSNVDGENVTLIAPSVDPDDAKYLTINDNPFAYTQEKRTQLIQAIFDKINGFGYSSFVLSNCLYPQLECGDLIKIKNKEGQLVNSIVLRPTFNEAVINLEAPSTITSTVSYVQPESAIDVAKRTEIVVDKQNQTITAIVTNVDDNTEAINNIASEGESTTNPFVLENAAELNYIQVDIHGNSYQETTTGKNLYKPTKTDFSIGGVNVTIEENVITLNGEMTVNLVEINIGANVEIEANQYYKLSYHVLSGTGKISHVHSELNVNGELTWGWLSSRQVAKSSSEAGILDKMIIYCNEKATFDNYQIVIQVEKVDSEDSPATDYEEYTGGEPSPNPDYPQEITTIKDSVKIIQIGKNLFDKNTITASYFLNQDGTIHPNTNYCVSDFIPITPNTTYFFPRRGTQRTKFYDKNKTALTSAWDVVDGDVSSTTPENAYYVRISILTTTNGSVEAVDINKFQFEQGSIATEYEEYKSKEYDIDLQGNELVKLADDIKDIIEIDKLGNVSLLKNTTKKIFDGTESWHEFDNHNLMNCVRFRLKYDINDINALCDKLQLKSTNEYWLNDIECLGYSATGYYIVGQIKKSRLDENASLQSFKDFLAENNLTVYHKLAEPTTSSLGKIDDFVAFKGNSTLFIETNIEPSYQLCRYYKDSILTNYFPTKNEVETKFEITNGKIESSINEIKNLIKYVSNSGSLTIENASENNLSLLSIKGDISLLFGNDGKQYGKPQFFNEDLYFSEDLLFTEGVPLAEPLYPSPNLFGKNMNLIVENGENEKQTYKLPFSYLNYISQEVADEFVLENGKAKIIRRVGINSSMKKYELPEEVIEELGELVINLKEGTNKVYLQCFDSAIYTAGYMEKNDYTEQFATKVELNSSITQLSNEINLEVNGKIDTLDEDINAKLELKVDTKNLVSEINASADVIRLDSNRFSMTSDYSSITEDGEATFKKADIGGFITDENSFSKDLNGIYDYSEFDLQFLRYVLLEYVNISNDASTKNILDVINDGELDSADLLAIREIIQGLRTNNKVVQGSFYINSNNPKNCFVIKDNSGDVVVSLGLGGVNSNQVVTQNIVCANTKTTDTSLNKYVTINGIDGNIKASGKVEATTITQTSIAEKKKNFELYQDALSEIAKIDIYKYNLVDEQDGDKKHIGFVIGDKFNYSEEITNKENNQVDLYSMMSMCMQGLKQQQEIIKKLEKRIEVLENENIGKN